MMKVSISRKADSSPVLDYVQGQLLSNGWLDSNNKGSWMKLNEILHENTIKKHVSQTSNIIVLKLNMQFQDMLLFLLFAH